MPTRLIVNADDFGLSECVNDGIIESAKAGVIRSTTLLACGRAFDHAVELARGVPELNVGIHLCLDEETPILPAHEIATIVGDDGRFLDRTTLLKRLLLTREIDLDHVRDELEAQIRRCDDAGIALSHFDGHGHAHVYPGVAEVVIDLARQYGIGAGRLPLESVGFLGGGFNLGDYVNKLIVAAFSLRARSKFRAAGIAFPEVFYGMMYGGRLSAALLRGLVKDRLRGIPCGTTVEIMTHPGHFDADELADYRHWNYHWEIELEALRSLSCDLARDGGFEIISFEELV